MLALLPAGSLAQTRLTLSRLPSSAPSHLPVGPLWVLRELPDGGPDVAGALTVGLSADGGVWATDPDNAGWGGLSTVNIPNGASRSQPLFLRFPATGQFMVGATAGTATPASANLTVTPFSFEDSFERQPLGVLDSPPGKWVRVSGPAGGCSVSQSAAHRGDGGLITADTRTSPGTQIESNLFLPYAPYQGDVFFRGWMRLSASNERGRTSIVKSEEPTYLRGQWDLQYAPGGRLVVSLWDQGATPISDNPLDGGIITPGTWHLVEVAYRGAQTPDASVEGFVDGRLVTSLAHVDVTGADLRSAGIHVGAFFQVDGLTTLSLEWDDVRLAGTAHGERLEVLPRGPIVAGGCAPFTVTLRDPYGAPARAPYELSLSSAGGPSYSAAPDCSPAAPVLAADSASTIVYASFSSPGVPTVTVAHPDFLSGATEIVVLPAGADAGTDADGGADLEPTDPRMLHVGCGCTSQPSAMLAIALVLLGAFGRRPTRVKRMTQ